MIFPPFAESLESGSGRVADTEVLIEKLVIVLRDGRKMIGVLRSWDQFGKREAVLSGKKKS